MGSTRGGLRQFPGRLPPPNPLGANRILETLLTQNSGHRSVQVVPPAVQVDTYTIQVIPTTVRIVPTVVRIVPTVVQDIPTTARVVSTVVGLVSPAVRVIPSSVQVIPGTVRVVQGFNLSVYAPAASNSGNSTDDAMNDTRLELSPPCLNPLIPLFQEEAADMVF